MGRHTQADERSRQIIDNHTHQGFTFYRKGLLSIGRGDFCAKMEESEEDNITQRQHEVDEEEEVDEEVEVNEKEEVKNQERIARESDAAEVKVAEARPNCADDENEEKLFKMMVAKDHDNREEGGGDEKAFKEENVAKEKREEEMVNARKMIEEDEMTGEMETCEEGRKQEAKKEEGKGEEINKGDTKEEKKEERNNDKTREEMAEEKKEEEGRRLIILLGETEFSSFTSCSVASSGTLINVSAQGEGGGGGEHGGDEDGGKVKEEEAGGEGGHQNDSSPIVGEISKDVLSIQTGFVLIYISYSNFRRDKWFVAREGNRGASVWTRGQVRSYSAFVLQL